MKLPHNIKDERWLPVVGYEGWYEVSNLGNIKRVNGDNSARAGKILKPGSSHGYKRAGLYIDGIERSFHVHQIVLSAFVGPRPPKMEVNHIDGDKSNNRLDNLEYVTHSENLLHAFKAGLLSRKGEKNSQSKLTENDVHKIRLLLKDGLKQTEIAKMFDVARNTIHQINSKKTWGWLKEEKVIVT